MTTTWPEVPLGDVAEIVSGITKGRKLNGRPVRPVPYLAVANVQDRHLRLTSVKSIEATEAEIERYRLIPGDLLLTEGGDPDKLGRGTVWSGEVPECIHQNHVFRLRIHDRGLVPSFVSRLIASDRGRRYFLRSAKQTTGIASINKTQLAAFPLLKPPLDEQVRIVSILDAADQLRAKGRESLALLGSLTESIFLEMFGADVGDQSHSRLIELNEIIDAERPICYGILKPGPDLEHGRPYIRVVDMRDGTIDYRSVRRTSLDIDHQYRRSRLRKGDLLMSIRGHVGRLAMVPPELDGANITQDSARLAVQGAEPEYVLEYLRLRRTQAWMAQNTKGVAVRGINIRDVRRVPFLAVDRASQRRFVATVRRVHDQLTAAREMHQSLEELAASLEQRAFRGEL